MPNFFCITTGNAPLPPLLSYLITFRCMPQKSFTGVTPPGLLVRESDSTRFPILLFSPLDPASAAMVDSPAQWFGKPKEEILQLREDTLVASKPFNQSSASDPHRELLQLQEMAASEMKLDVELNIFAKKEPIMEFLDVEAPLGGSTRLESVEYYSNPKIPLAVEKAWSDTDAKSRDLLKELYQKDITISHLQRVLSLGMLGVEPNRRLVPTKRSIPAVDKTLSDYLLEKIREYPTVDSLQFFFTSYIDNHFLVILFPREWSFELVEAWQKGSGWNLDQSAWYLGHDFEPFEGRTTYVKETAGAYFAARYSVCEYLHKIKRQASVVVLRRIGSSYVDSLGVWVIRESVKEALQHSSTNIHSLNDMHPHINEQWLPVLPLMEKKSFVMDRIKHQKRLMEFA